MEEGEEMQVHTDMFGEDPQNEDKLLPVLRSRLFDSTFMEGMRMIKHPLVNEVFFASWKISNTMYVRKLAAYKDALAKGRWSNALWFIERPWRLPYLFSWWKRRRITREELRELLTSMWVDAELPSQYERMPLTLFKAAGFITDMDGKGSELDFLLPKQAVTIYRGAALRYRDGLAWTKSAERAGWFARRLSSNDEVRVVWQATVTPDRILGIFLGRGEEEVVVDPWKLKDIKEVEQV